MNSEKVANRLPFRVRKTALKIDRAFNKRHSAHECIVTLATDMWDTMAMMMIAVGLISGTRIWYAMWDAEHHEDKREDQREDLCEDLCEDRREDRREDHHEDRHHEDHRREYHVPVVGN
eukprot:COSAG02_NODE_4345_length_5473_cov_3.666915_3_plen_119_part_00